MPNAVTEYYRMPPLYQLEDYDRCMFGQAHPEKQGIYCFTKTLIQPNKSLDVWNIIDVSNIVPTKYYMIKFSVSFQCTTEFVVRREIKND